MATGARRAGWRPGVTLATLLLLTAALRHHWSDESAVSLTGAAKAGAP
ncbi:MAG TPA: hypothetical protein VHH34_25055 [Pseudonocardiaceae bacterium]|nr:hypothetical protein [Pseudonocardiaceae bacterium]